MRLKKLTYTTGEKKSPSFKDLYFTRSDITFSEQDQYAIFKLKRDKTNINHTGVLIMLAAMNNTIYPILVLLYNNIIRKQS